MVGMAPLVSMGDHDLGFQLSNERQQTPQQPWNVVNSFLINTVKMIEIPLLQSDEGQCVQRLGLAEASIFTLWQRFARGTILGLTRSPVCEKGHAAVW